MRNKMKNGSTCTPGLITGTPPPVEQTVESKGSHATLIPLLTEQAPFGLMKVLTAIRDNDVTRLYQEWKYLRDDRIVKTPYHEFAEQMDAEISATAEATCDAWSYSTNEAVCGTCGEFDSYHEGRCPKCYAAECRKDYLDGLIAKLQEETVVFTDGTAAPLKSGVIPAGVKFNAIALIAVNIGIGLLMGVFAFVPAETVLANIQWVWRAI